MLPHKLYEIFRWFVWIVLPAIGVLVTTLVGVWGWNFPLDAFLSTLSAIELFLGTILGLSKYNSDKK